MGCFKCSVPLLGSVPVPDQILFWGDSEVGVCPSKAHLQLSCYKSPGMLGATDGAMGIMSFLSGHSSVQNGDHGEKGAWRSLPCSLLSRASLGTCFSEDLAPGTELSSCRSTWSTAG